MAVYGVGINDLGRRNHHYPRWCGMLRRSYDTKFQQTNPTYVGSSVCPEWLTLSCFSIWCDQFQWEGMQLDKDLLAPETTGKLYCPEVCIPVPQWLNLLFNDHRSDRGEYATGVHFHKQRQKFQARLGVDGSRQNLGLFLTEDEAFQAYNTAKADYVRSKYPQIASLHRGGEIILAIERKYLA
jgi:hypothetical protein